MPDRRTGLVILLCSTALVATSLGVRGWADRAPADVGRTSVQAAGLGEPAPGGPASAGTVPEDLARPGASAAARRPAGSGPPVRRQPAAPSPPAARALPVAVEVPRLGVNASVDPVGVEADGRMTIPRDAARVGWYRFGSAPGEGVGSAVLAGHVDTRRDGPGAFYPLAEAAVGDEVVLRRDDGSRLRYRVVGRELLVKAALPVDSVFDRSGPERLTLITCGGPFDAGLRSYRDNLVITAEPMRQSG